MVDPTRKIAELATEIQKVAAVARRDFELLEVSLGQAYQALDRLTDQIGLPRAPRVDVASRIDWTTKKIAELQKQRKGQ